MESLANVLVAIESNPAKLFYKNSTAFNLSFLVYIPTSNLLYLGQILSVPPNVEMTVGDTAMQANKWISGKYWVGASGAMATNSWIDGEKYYIGSNGDWIPNYGKGSSSAQQTKVFYASGSSVYHTHNCRSAARISSPIYITLAEAKPMNLQLCKNCA